MATSFDEAYESYLDDMGPHRLRTFSVRNARGRIVAAAKQILCESPYVPITIQSVAERAVLSRRAVYNYFRDSEALCRIAQMVTVHELALQLPRELDPQNGPLEAISAFTKEAAGLLSSPSHIGLLRTRALGRAPDQELDDAYQRLVCRPMQRNIESYLLHKCLEGKMRGRSPVEAARELVVTIECRLAFPRLFGRASAGTAHLEVEAVVTGFLDRYFG
jgi:AcrR family transcriptional regulator